MNLLKGAIAGFLAIAMGGLLVVLVNATVGFDPSDLGSRLVLAAACVIVPLVVVWVIIAIMGD